MVDPERNGQHQRAAGAARPGQSRIARRAARSLRPGVAIDWSLRPSMTQLRTIDQANCWTISGVRSAEMFFRVIPQLVEDATHLFLEGPYPKVAALLQPHVDESDYRAPVGTLWSWPRNRRLTLRVSPSLFARLCEATAQFVEPEICSHLHFYRDDEPLVHWFDAFTDPIVISRRFLARSWSGFVRRWAES
jgi:hypothetical protein